MNRVLRSPQISEKPYVIPVQSASAPEQDDAEEGFQGFGPSTEPSIEDEEETEASSEEKSEADASASEEAPDKSGSEEDTTSEGPDSGDQSQLEPNDAADEGSSEPGDAEGDAPSGEPDEASEGSDPPTEGTDDLASVISAEEGEMMISLEKVAEHEAAVTSGAESETPTEELPASATEIEAIVEARLKEFEERFQQEKEDAYHAGFEDGTNEGMKQGLNQAEEEVVRFQELVDTLTGQWKDTLRTYEAAVTDLAIRIARKIIDVEIDHNSESVLQAVHACLGYVEDKTKVIIRVNPDDLEAVRRHRNDWLESLESIDHLLIEAEPTVAKGGCVVETPIGDVDAQIEERLERLRIALLEEINRTDTNLDPDPCTHTD
ncbi:TPA: hypothetical protein DCE37_20330 [Candidatus Latescibacteria bacterium]|nr:hypothetical protein [Candidatus Latescibacterota bacterium]